MPTSRYIYDVLYGKIYFPEFFWKLITNPELQRLREIRLCNINSLCLTGGANINRYEHAIGTAYLATICADNWFFKRSISDREYKILIAAALFHDVANSAFGHTLEYIESKEGYNPENAFNSIVLGSKSSDYNYKEKRMQQIFFGSFGRLLDTLKNDLHLTESDIISIGNSINGKPPFGALISNQMDLDNLDNVVRLAYHIGLTTDARVPIEIARNLLLKEDGVVLNHGAISSVQKWQNIRELLYLYLLRNPQEFAGKCMLTEAIEHAKQSTDVKYYWYDTDNSLLEKLQKVPRNEDIIRRLMIGDLYGCICIVSSNNLSIQDEFINFEKRGIHEKALSLLLRTEIGKLFSNVLIGIHAIVDKGKTNRKIALKDELGEIHNLGNNSEELFIGIFTKNVNLNMTSLDSIRASDLLRAREFIGSYVQSITKDDTNKFLKLYEEGKYEDYEYQR